MNSNLIHVFERAGLGKAPFRYTGMTEASYQACPGAPVQPGAGCDFCGRGIRYVFHVRSADGKQFKVGSDCIAKTGDAGLRKAISADKQKLDADKRVAHAMKKAEAAREILARDDVREALAAEPHPYAWMAEKGHTRLSWAEWMLDNAGNKGRVTVANYLQKRFS